MLNKEKHQLIMGQILKDIYTDTSIAPFLGLKGGTGAYLFYGLPRFSVDLDFDCFSTGKTDQKVIFDKIAKILAKYGVLKDSYLKRFTIFMLLSYGDKDHNIKVEISTRNLVAEIKSQYELKEYLGISMWVAKREYLFSCKLAALTLRSQVATRDIYDIYYFAKNNWDIDQKIVEIITGKKFNEHLTDCLRLIESIAPNQILGGLGELLNDQEKIWAKQNLKKEVIFLLKNYQRVVGSTRAPTA